ncbi:MAG: hypothetical protein WA885_17550 [Phormidesmis sp.]
MSFLSELQNKKLGVFDLLAMGFSLYLQHFRSFASLFGIVLLPFSIVINVLALYPPSNNFALISSLLFYLVYFFIVIPVYMIAFAVLAEGHVADKNPQISTALNHILSQLLPLTGLSLRYGIAYALRSVLLIVPGIIYAVNNYYYSLAFILRGQRGKAAFQYSRTLVKGNWWKVFSFFLLVMLAAFGLPMFVGRILTSFISNSPTLVAIVSNVIASLVSLGFGIGGVLLFLNLDYQKR